MTLIFLATISSAIANCTDDINLHSFSTSKLSAPISIRFSGETTRRSTIFADVSRNEQINTSSKSALKPVVSIRLSDSLRRLGPFFSGKNAISFVALSKPSLKAFSISVRFHPLNLFFNITGT